jgi:hypothetical protein
MDHGNLLYYLRNEIQPIFYLRGDGLERLTLIGLGNHILAQTLA